MNEKFTPGPWVIALNTCIATEDGEGGTMDWFAETYGPDDSINAANANLIAAAPDLYEALKDMLSGWRYIRETHGDLYGVGWERSETLAIKALAKARGES